MEHTECSVQIVTPSMFIRNHKTQSAPLPMNINENTAKNATTKDKITEPTASLFWREYIFFFFLCTRVISKLISSGKMFWAKFF